ncbi:MAG: lipid-A-disaccharide synthase [Verrucomicrobiae bacterium]|nr:lipid-A-disaccharide synthase [Verrucomicrobiae bacterium]
MLIAGEPSGDLLAAELVGSLRERVVQRGGVPPQFFGAGGPRMGEAGVELQLDLTQYAIIGLADVLRNLWRLRRILEQMLDLACARRPEVIVCVDYGGFNRRFAAALRARQTAGWRPHLVQYVSPQVWASRPGRARTLARDLDLLVSILPIEPAWYARRHPRLRVEFVGHPIVDRHPAAAKAIEPPEGCPRRVVLLPGSRPSEIARHWPLMLEAARRVAAGKGPAVEWVAVFPDDSLRQAALAADKGTDLALECRVGGLSEELARATLSIASTGTVTLECALWRVPTLAIYQASWSTYQIARRIIRVRHLALPNLLAPAPVMPEFLQTQATPETIAAEAGRLLCDADARRAMRERLGDVVAQLGPPGAVGRAAEAILGLLPADPRGPAAGRDRPPELRTG